MKVPAPTILAGQLLVAIQGANNSTTFPYRGAERNQLHEDAPPRDKAFEEAHALYRKLQAEHPDQIIRLLDFPIAEFFL